MKYFRKVLLTLTFLICLLLASQSANAQRNTADYLICGASGGYSRLCGATPEMDVKGLATGGIHIGWEVRRMHLIYRPLFAEFQYFSSRCNTDFQIEDVPIKDTRLGDATMHFQMLSPLTETQHFMFTNLCSQVGYSGNDLRSSRLHGALYFLAGIKLSFKCDLSNDVNLKYKTSATYERYIDDYEDMPNHYYTEHESSKKEKFGFKVGLMFAGEAGWELNLNKIDKLKIGAFIDFGLTPIMYDVERSQIELNKEDITNVLVSSYYKSNAMKDKYVIPAMAGLKITYTFNANYSMDCLKVKCRMGYRIKNK